METCLIQDTREQRGLGILFKSPWVIDTLQVGDYSVAGLENRIAIERKSLPDLLGSLSDDTEKISSSRRERLEKELSRSRHFDYFAVVVETSLSLFHDSMKARELQKQGVDLEEFANKEDDPYRKYRNAIYEWETTTGWRPAAAWGSIMALTVRHRRPFYFTINRETTATFIEDLLVKYAREFTKTAHEIHKAARRLDANF